MATKSMPLDVTLASVKNSKFSFFPPEQGQGCPDYKAGVRFQLKWKIIEFFFMPVLGIIVLTVLKFTR